MLVMMTTPEVMVEVVVNFTVIGISSYLLSIYSIPGNMTGCLFIRYHCYYAVSLLFHEVGIVIQVLSKTKM